MAKQQKYAGSILMISVHGYVAGQPQLGKPDTGGQVVFVLELAKRFRRLGYRVDLLTRRFERQPAVDKITEGLRVLRVPFGGNKFIRKEDMHDHIADFVTNALAYFRENKLTYDVVNSHYWDAGWSGQRIAEEMEIAHVHTPHSLGSWKKKGMVEAGQPVDDTYRFDERIAKEFLVYRNCDHVIPTTDQQEAILAEDYGVPRDHMTMIPPGMDEARFMPAQPALRAAIQKKHGFKQHDVYAVGRVATNKGYDLLIKSLPYLREAVPKARVVIAAGANSERDKRKVNQLKAIAEEAGVSKHVKWKGYVPDDELADHYRSAAVFAMCSRYEPFGMTAIEAMACGTPTVVTVHGGLHEVINYGTHALYADPKQPYMYAAALATPMLYPELGNRLSIEGARFARRQFGWTGIARRTLAIFNRLIGRYESSERLEGSVE
ncbi:glycosyltransferase [Mucisphaera calidilacus]|uniref:Mannosylfructose-phosphate synthase n=1 Tax=Mucisphaera calidilacus TaxID=2527982 RepID=A0A518C043_9BACT|nr:glycosyltransferase [Mucisphaera calidilacus]QDU72591.1 Mannosylfructose-phosphate synthase [Mucisphaera calidilacus]